MDTSPQERLHIRCKCIFAQDVKSFRLMNRRFASIGAEYLLTQVHLIFEKESVRRLGAISRYPVISRTIKLLFYEFTLLETLDPESEWLARIQKSCKPLKALPEISNKSTKPRYFSNVASRAKVSKSGTALMSYPTGGLLIKQSKPDW